jgi:DNA-binding transcriptional LysR family regulator
MLLARSIENLCREFKNLQIQVVVDESHSLMTKVERRDLDAAVILLIDDARVPEGLSGDLLRACNKTHSKAAAAPASCCCWRTFIWLMCSFLMRCGI